ncbi:hypothetical protein COOONC_27279 [Cooperia oncophora]
MDTRDSTHSRPYPKDTEETVLLQSTNRTSRKEICVLLSTGCARLWSTIMQRWEGVDSVRHWSGRSFISEALAQRICLTYTTSQKLRMRTFGTEEPSTTLRKLTTVDIWNMEGRKYPMQLSTTPILRGTVKAVHLTPADQTGLVMVNSFTKLEEDLERSDKYWAMKSWGSCEFMGTKDAEKKASTNSKQEILQKPSDSKQIFKAELRKNLRELLANDLSLSEELLEDV